MERLLILRKKAGKTQETVASHLGVARNTYTRYETGERAPDFDTLKKLAEYYETTTSYLLGETDDPAPYSTAKSPVYDNEALELMEEMHKRPELKVLFSTSRRATREDIELADQMLRRMARESGYGYDDD